MVFRPLHDHIAVRRVDNGKTSKGGVIIPDTFQETPGEGVVVSTGPGTLDQSGKLVVLDVKEGDHVLFGKLSGIEVTVDGEQLLIIKESDIMAVVGPSELPGVPGTGSGGPWKPGTGSGGS